MTSPRKINLIGDESLCIKADDACKDKREERTGDDVFAHRFLYRFEVSSAPLVFLLSSPVLGSWVNQERVVKRKTDGLVSLKVGFWGGGKLCLAAGLGMPFSVTGLAGDVLAALDKFVRKADIFLLGDFSIVVGFA